MSDESKPKLTIGDCSTLDYSGARNVVYAIPAEEHNDGIAHVFVWSCVGAGEPMHAYHSRWLCLGTVPQRAVEAEIENVLREHEEEILSALSAYKGAEWNGHNHVGRWARDIDEELDRAPYGVTAALREVPCYWDPGDWFQPVGFQDFAQDVSLTEAAKHEVENARDNDAYLELDDVRSYMHDAAVDFLKEHGKDKNPDLKDAKRIARKWTKGS